LIVLDFLAKFDVLKHKLLQKGEDTEKMSKKHVLDIINRHSRAREQAFVPRVTSFSEVTHL
jgi:hypothetical protein